MRMTNEVDGAFIDHQEFGFSRESKKKKVHWEKGVYRRIKKYSRTGDTYTYVFESKSKNLIKTDNYSPVNRRNGIQRIND